jgi:YVTN family beta-propeller protein
MRKGLLWACLALLLVVGGLPWAAAPTSSQVNIGVVHVGGQIQALAPNSSTGRLYVASREIDRLTVIDAASRQILASVAVGAFPSAVAVNETTNLVYVANRDGGSVSVVDGASHQVTATLRLQPGFNPESVAIDPRRNILYVGQEGDARVLAFDGATLAPLADFEPPLQRARAATTDLNANAWLAAYNENALAGDVFVPGFGPFAIGTTPVGRGPVGVGLDPIADALLVANALENTLTIVDAHTGQVTGTVPVGALPMSVVTDAVSYQIFVANALDDTLTVYDPRTGAMVATIDLPFGTTPTHLAIDAFNRRLYLSDALGNVAILVNLAARVSVRAHQEVEPVLECVILEGGGAFTAVFGYNNP